MIVTIDGPAGVGKSSVARFLSARLQFDFLDTGAMYRAVALAALRSGLSRPQESSKAHQGLAELLTGLQLEMTPESRVLLNGEDVTQEIRTPEVTACSSELAVFPLVRARLVELQRQIASMRNIVCEGRDQGTVVFPQARCKFFLIADLTERLERRQRDLEAQGVTVDKEELRRTLQERDWRDSNRAVGPLVCPTDALTIDTTHQTLLQVVDQMEQLVRQRLILSETQKRKGTSEDP